MDVGIQESCEEEKVNGFLLDTHSWLWTIRRASGEVSANFFQEVEGWQRRKSLHLSAVSFWEVGLLVAAGRLQLPMPVDRLLDLTTRDEAWNLLPLSPRILLESTRLPGAIHRDPSDRMLVATAREHGLTLVTRDDKLLKYAKHGHLNARKP